jgi:phosphatidylserine decarboxylase
VVPPYAREIVRRDWRGWGVRLARGAEMARFEMGSTVIVLVPSGRLEPALQPESVVRVGQRLGICSEAPIKAQS